MKHYKFIGYQFLINILSIWLWESFLRKTIAGMKTWMAPLMEYAQINNPWFIIFFLSVNILFTSIMILWQKKHKKQNSNIQTYKKPAKNKSSKPLSTSTLNSLLSDKPHKCSHCGYSFSLMPELEEGTSCLVKNPKCPECGNVDEVLRFYKG